MARKVIVPDFSSFFMFLDPMGPLLFSLHINDITSDIESEIRLFADDCVCYREIKNVEDTVGTVLEICNRQFQSAVTRGSDDEIPSKGTSPFTAMGEITVDPNGVIKLLNNLNIHKAPGPDGLSARVLKECSSEIAPVLTYIFN